MSRRAVVAAVMLVVIGAAIATLLLSRARQGPQQAARASARASMEFTRDGLAGEITTEVGRVAGPERVQVAIRERDGGRWACILADSAERYHDLDEGVTVEDFPGLREGGFSAIPSHIARTSSSIFRSVAKRAMGYDRGRGDRIIVILCPRAEWPQLRLSWPP